jgi:uncharacterized membrane protein
VDRKLATNWWSFTSFFLGIAIAFFGSVGIACLIYFYLQYVKIHAEKSVLYNEYLEEEAEKQF